MLLQNCDVVPTDKITLLNEVICLADCGEFSEYTKSKYYASKRDRTPAAYMEYLNTAEAEYRTLFQA